MSLKPGQRNQFSGDVTMAPPSECSLGRHLFCDSLACRLCVGVCRNFNKRLGVPY